MDVVPLITLDQALPLKCRMVPRSPTAQTSVAPLPQIPLRPLVVPLSRLDQALPFQWRMVSSSFGCVAVSPTTQTSLAPLPQTPLSPPVVPLVTLDQALPFQCRTLPEAPTAQTSLASLPHADELDALPHQLLPFCYRTAFVRRKTM